MVGGASREGNEPLLAPERGKQIIPVCLGGRFEGWLQQQTQGERHPKSIALLCPLQPVADAALSRAYWNGFRMPGLA